MKIGIKANQKNKNKKLKQKRQKNYKTYKWEWVERFFFVWFEQEDGTPCVCNRGGEGGGGEEGEEEWNDGEEKNWIWSDKMTVPSRLPHPFY